MIRVFHRALSVFFLLFLSVFGLLLFFGKAPETIAEERRYAAEKPTLSYASLTSGEFLRQSEAYFLDLFPCRRSFLSFHTKIFTKFLQNPNAHGIRTGTYGLEKALSSYDEALVLSNIERLEGIARRHFQSERVFCALIPHKSHYTVSPDVYQRAWDALSGSSRFVPIEVSDTLTASDYFYGDIHVRPECYASLAERLSENLSFSRTPALTASRVFVSRGTLALQFPCDETDAFSALYDPSGVIAGCTVTANGKARLFYDEGALANDPYDLYLGGEAGGGLIVVKNPSAKEEKRLVILRDSFTRALLPHLVGGYSEIVLCDLRLPRAAMEAALKEYAPFADSVLILLSTHTLLSTRF